MYNTTANLIQSIDVSYTNQLTISLYMQSLLDYSLNLNKAVLLFIYSQV